jgi:hypothetical protein
LRRGGINTLSGDRVVDRAGTDDEQARAIGRDQNFMAFRESI